MNHRRCKGRRTAEEEITLTDVCVLHSFLTSLCLSGISFILFYWDLRLVTHEIVSVRSDFAAVNVTAAVVVSNKQIFTEKLQSCVITLP